MYGYTLNEHYQKRKGETIEKEIQLPNQSQQEFDSINRGKMQYQTDLNHLWLRNFFYDWFSVCNNEPEIFLKCDVN